MSSAERSRAERSMCQNKAMSAKVLKRTSAAVDETKVVRYVVETDHPNRKAVKGRVSPLSAKADAPKRSAAKTARRAQSTFTVLKTVERANPYLRSPEEVLEVAKRAGIFTQSGKLRSVFS
jgi:hypothetical protein